MSRHIFFLLLSFAASAAAAPAAAPSKLSQTWHSRPFADALRINSAEGSEDALLVSGKQSLRVLDARDGKELFTYQLAQSSNPEIRVLLHDAFLIGTRALFMAVYTLDPKKPFNFDKSELRLVEFANGLVTKEKVLRSFPMPEQLPSWSDFKLRGSTYYFPTDFKRIPRMGLPLKQSCFLVSEVRRMENRKRTKSESKIKDKGSLCLNHETLELVEYSDKGLLALSSNMKLAAYFPAGKRSSFAIGEFPAGRMIFQDESVPGKLQILGFRGTDAELFYVDAKARAIRSVRNLDKTKSEISFVNLFTISPKIPMPKLGQFSILSDLERVVLIANGKIEAYALRTGEVLGSLPLSSPEGIYDVARSLDEKSFYTLDEDHSVTAYSLAP